MTDDKDFKRIVRDRMGRTGEPYTTAREMLERSESLRRSFHESVGSDGVLDFLQDASLDGVWYWAIDEPRHKWINGRFMRALGYREAEVDDVDRWWLTCIDDDDHRRLLDAIDRHIADRAEPIDQIVRFHHRDGSTVWMRCRGVSVRSNGRTTHVFVAAIDISSLKEIETALEASNQRLREFAGSIAHDLRSPITAIRGLLSAVLDGEMDPEESADLLRRAREVTRRTSELIELILEYATAAGSDLDAAEVDLSPVVDRVVRNVAEAAEAVGAVLSIADDLPAVYGEEAALAQIVRNLLDNAIKHRDPARPLVIKVDATTSAGQVVLRVADNGVGVDERDRRRIFALRPRLAAAQETPGAGAGLAISRLLALRMGGSLDVVDGADGVGSTFRVRLPSAARPEFRAAIDKRWPMHVVSAMVVDDNEDSILLARHQLRDVGVNVVAEVDDEAAVIPVYTALSDHPDVVVLDYRMRTMDGLDVARALLEINPLQRIVMYTNYLSPDLEREALAVGIAACVGKEHRLAPVVLRVGATVLERST